jgi:hypothetical protein
MAERPEGGERQPDRRRSVDLHSMIFWIISYMPVGMLFSLILNSVAPLFIAACLGYLTTQSLDS